MEDIKFAIKVWLISIGIVAAILGTVAILSVIYG